MSFGDELRKAADRETIEPPPGHYKVTLDDTSAWESPKDGREFAKITLKIIDGEHEGSLFEHWLRFGSPMAKEMSAEALSAYGVLLANVETIEDVDDQLAALAKTGTTADVTVSYGGDEGQFLNVKVHGSRTEGKSDIPTDMEPEQKPAASFASAAGTDDETIPF